MSWLPLINRSYNIKPIVLLSLDGFGVAPPSKGNAVYLAKTPHYDHYVKAYPHATLIASGESVGLPANEVGNSEVGHLTMGIGRVIYQSLEKINHSIRDESYYNNQAFLHALNHVQKTGGKLHLMGMVGSGHVHSSTAHYFSLLELCKRQGFNRVFSHLFTDGRDSPPQEAEGVMAQIMHRVQEYGFGQVVTIAGRYYAMDRDGRWERIQKAYEAMTMGVGPRYSRPEDAIKAIYAENKSDEFVTPSVIAPEGSQPITIDDNDAVIFFNFRVDRARELTMAFTIPQFESMSTGAFGFGGSSTGSTTATFERKKIPNNLEFVTMTQYQENLPVSAVAFPPETEINNSLAELIARAGMKQYHLAESEKERMVTYYFDGMRSQRFAGETVEIIPSPKVATYDKKPEMSAMKIVRACKKALRKDEYAFMILNFANPDMVAHTGSLEATIKAIEVTDKAVGEIVQEVEKHDGVVIVSADHGNAEELITFPTDNFFYTSDQGTVNTDHSNNPIPFLLVGKRFVGQTTDLGQGVMSDIAPTLCGLLGLPVPAEMTGRDLMTQNNIQK